MSPPPGLDTVDGSIGPGSLEHAKGWGRPGALASYDGRGAQSQGLAAAQSAQSPTATADGRDRGDFCSQRKKDQPAAAAQRVNRVRRECKATVSLGAVSRGGLPRGEDAACDHDLGLKEQDLPWGMVEADRAQLPSTLGSSYTPRDCLVETLAAWWAAWAEAERVVRAQLQITRDKGPESSGKRTQLLHRMVACCDAIGQPMQLLYSPPSHSKYHPLERCWGILEVHWNGTTLVDVETMGEGAKTMTGKGLHPLVERSRKGDHQGVTLSQQAMRAVENRLQRHPELPQWDILIRPVSTS